MTTDTAFSILRIPHNKLVLRGSEALHEWRERHVLEVPGAKHTWLYKRKRWDGTWRPGECRERSTHVELRISRGLLDRLCQELGMPVPQLEEEDPSITPYLEWVRTLGLRDFQEAGIEAILRQYWARVALATNAGKGAIIALVAQWAWQQGYPAAILCDELAVWDALEEQCQRWAPKMPVVRVGQGMESPPAWSSVALCMVPTLARRLARDRDEGWKHPDWAAWWQAQRVLLLDEADKATADTWQHLLNNANDQWRAGFSGTFADPQEQPYADWMQETLLGPIRVEARNAEMVERGISAKPTITLIGYDAGPLLPMAENKKWWRGKKGADLRRMVFDMAILSNSHRHAFIASLVRPDVPTAIVVNRIEHGRQLTAAIPGAIFLDGEVSLAHRNVVLDAFQSGKIKIIVVTKILDRGTNRLGVTSDLIFASGEGSTRQTLQRLGRGLRRTDGKEFLRVVDIMDRGHAYLTKAAAARVALYASENFLAEIIP